MVLRLAWLPSHWASVSSLSSQRVGEVCWRPLKGICQWGWLLESLAVKLHLGLTLLLSRPAPTSGSGWQEVLPD